MLSLYKLKIFTTVAEEGSFTKTAQKLYLTQAAISQHIHTLETQLGTLLFERTQRGVYLTPAGENLLKYAKQILWLAEAAESTTTDITKLKEGSLNLGATPSASIYLLPDWMQRFRENFPSISISLKTDITGNLIEQIKSKKLELGILEGEIREDSVLQVTPLKDTILLVVVAPDHPWVGRDAISIQDIGEQPFIARRMDSQTRSWVDRLLDEHEITPQIAYEMDDPESIKRAVMRKMGISILPTCAIQTELKSGKLVSLPIKEKILRRQLKCVSSVEYPLSATARAFLAMLSKDFPALRDFVHAPFEFPKDLL